MLRRPSWVIGGEGDVRRTARCGEKRKCSESGDRPGRPGSNEPVRSRCVDGFVDHSYIWSVWATFRSPRIDTSLIQSIIISELLHLFSSLLRRCHCVSLRLGSGHSRAGRFRTDNYFFPFRTGGANSDKCRSLCFYCFSCFSESFSTLLLTHNPSMISEMSSPFLALKQTPVDTIQCRIWA